MRMCIRNHIRNHLLSIFPWVPSSGDAVSSASSAEATLDAGNAGTLPPQVRELWLRTKRLLVLFYSLAPVGTTTPSPSLLGVLLEKGEVGDSICRVVEEGGQNGSLSCLCVFGVPQSWVCGIHFLIS